MSLSFFVLFVSCWRVGWEVARLAGERMGLRRGLLEGEWDPRREVER